MYFVRFVLFCSDAVNDFLTKNCPYIAGAISFYTLFSLFPLVLALISITGFIMGPEAQQEQLADDIARVIPVSTSLVSDTVQGVVRTRTITGVASVLGLLWASTAVFSAIRKGINAAWGIKKTRPFIKERLIDFGLVLGAGLLILIIFFVTPIISALNQVTQHYLAEPDAARTFWGWAAQLTSPLLSFAAFLVLYRFLPNTEVRFRDVWLGALLASLAFYGAKWGFLWYIRTFSVYNVLYGSVGAVMALLTWVYVSAIILLFGALVTSRYAAFISRTSGDARTLKLLWAGLSRVRLRDVAPTEAG